jgi:hypothetical protein
VKHNPWLKRVSLFNIWEGKILMKVNGPVTDHGGCKFTIIKDLRQLNNSPDLVPGIKRRKLEHEIRVDQTRVA